MKYSRKPKSVLLTQSMKTTMDRYVHVMDESLVKAARWFEEATPVIYEKGVDRIYRKAETLENKGFLDR